MAYAAVVSLVQTLKNILNPNPAQHQIPYEKQQIESLLEIMSFIHDFLVDSSQKRSRDVHNLETKIRDAAHKAEDVIESRISEHFLSENWFVGFSRRQNFSQQLKIVAEEMDSIKREVDRINALRNGNDLPQTHSLPTADPGPARPVFSSENTMVGCKDIFEEIREQLVGGLQSKLQIIPITGMGGIGKTTLARNLYQDECIKYRFPIRAWVTISQNYRVREILLSLLRSVRQLSDENTQERDDQLVGHLYQSLKGRIYLIVIDDVWDTMVWDEVKMSFPVDSPESRILLTTRLSEVAAYVNPDRSRHHQVKLLNDNESWNLICSRVFNGECPSHELEQVGKRIARSCKGLPFAIVLICGYLSTVPRTRYEWKNVAAAVNSFVANDTQCREMLSLSYDNLPRPLKACFLYMVFFPEDFDVPVSKLVKLWIAERYLKPIESKSLEEVAEEYLADLISRNLILISEKRLDGKIKTCKIHDLTREFCLRKAEEEKFVQSINTTGTSAHVHSQRNRRFNGSGDSLESLGQCKLLRVLDWATEESFPSETIRELVHLRYVSLCCAEEKLIIPKFLPNSLWNLQTLVISKSSKKYKIEVHLPVEIWRMSQLRHLKFRNCYLPCPRPRDKSVLENLQTLSKINSSSCTQDLFKRTPNLKKLGIIVEHSDGFSLGNVVNLPHLEMLKIIVELGSFASIPTDYTLPPKLKKLTLTETKFHWREMSIVGSSPNLEELELINSACIGPEWEPNVGGFLKLMSLQIDTTDLEYWTADSDHFPKLQRLSLWECDKLKEFPCPSDIPTLELIKLDDASPSAVTKAKEMLTNQQDLGNDYFQVLVFPIWNNTYQKRKEDREAYYRRRKEEEERQRKRKEEEERSAKFQGMRGGPIPDSYRSRRPFDGFDTRRNDGFGGFGTPSSSRGGLGTPGFHGGLGTSSWSHAPGFRGGLGR